MPQDIFAQSQPSAVPVQTASVPRDIFAENNSQLSNPAPSMGAAGDQLSWLQAVNKSPTIQAVLGAGDALRNFYGDVANRVSQTGAGITNLTGANTTPINIPAAQSGSGGAYNLGYAAGNLGTFTGGGELLDAARAGAETLPYVGKIAQYLGQNGLGGMARRILGSSAYGAITNPNSVSEGAGEGALAGSAAEAVPLLAQGGAKLFNAFNPQKISDSILNRIQQNGDLETNNKNVSQKIRNSYLQQQKNASVDYEPIFKQVGNENIYNSGFPITDQTGESYSYDLSPQSQYKNLDKDVFNDYGRVLQNLHQEFSANPTFNNAHRLQMQLGKSARGLQDLEAKSGLNVDQSDQLDSYETAKDAIRNDMGNYLNAYHPNLAANGDNPNAYENSADNYVNNVVPYLGNKNIRAIAKGTVTNPRNLLSVFKNPEPSVQKVVQDLGPDVNNQIINSALGKIPVGAKPEIVLKALQNLNNQGLGSYKTPEIQAAQDALQNAIGKRNFGQTAFTAIGGGYLTHKLGGGIGADALMGTLSGGIVPYAARAVGRALAPIAQPITNFSKAVYPVLAKAAVANVLARRKQNNGS